MSERICNDLLVLSDYFDLLKENGLTNEEFAKYKDQCMNSIKTKNYASSPALDAKTLKFAHSLVKSGCITNDEYEIIKHRIEKLPLEDKQQKNKQKNAQEMRFLWEIFKFLVWILLIPFRVLWYFVEIFAYGWDKVAERDLLEDAMRRVKDEDD